MNKKKAKAVTVLFAIMLASIDAGLYMLYPLGFAVLTGLLALFGFVELSGVFAAWLSDKEEPLALPEVYGEPAALDADFTQTWEDIKRELEEETV